MLGFFQNSRQDSECFKPGLEEDTASRKLSTMPPPKELSPPLLGELQPPPPPSRMMPPPPPPSLRELPPPPPSRMMPPPPPSKFPSDHSSRKMQMPPPLPKLPSSQLLVEEVHSQNLDLRAAAASAETPVQRRVSEKATVEPASDSVLKLVEYEEEEEEDDMVASAEESCRSNIMRSRSSKPFWAV